MVIEMHVNMLKLVHSMEEKKNFKGKDGFKNSSIYSSNSGSIEEPKTNKIINYLHR